MPSATLSKMQTSTYRTSSRIDRTGKLIGAPMTAREFDRIAREHGARECTPEEARSSREAQIRAGLAV